MWKFATHTFGRSADEIGQATIEYAIATAGAVLAAYVVIQTFGEWLAGYIYDVIALICLPVP